MLSVDKCPYIFIFIVFTGSILELIGCNYCTKSSVLSFEKIFSSEMDKNDIYLGSSSKQNASFSGNLP